MATKKTSIAEIQEALPKSEVRFLDEFAARRTAQMKSQKGQDYWVQTELKNKRNGYFVDLAAADGLTHSNTYFLESVLNWHGLLIEPNPYFFKALEINRKSQCIDQVVSDKSEAIQFRVDNGQLGGIVADDTDNCSRLREEELYSAEIIERTSFSLTQILTEANAPSFIDYLSLDVEGAEDRVIRGLDFDKFTFGLLTIERASEYVNRTLFEKNYHFVRNSLFDTFYAHASVLERFEITLENFYQVSPKDW